ncbi:SOS response-associated peptidase [Mucilaginibacter sp. PAMB04274]|uniref:SOS response-associated peptidase n=1 Tax=Mucilaginibacter sp. PAMB04274 TaxID=3138568 RepID=UPI0031F69892
MCGRINFGSSTETAKRLGVKDGEPARSGDMNAFACKGTYIFGLVDKAPDTLRHFHWPLVPAWCNAYPEYHTHNARSEDMGQKPAFKHLLGKRHCIIAIDGFYEWERTGTKTPYYFSMADGSLMLLAGLWDYNTRLDTPLLSCTVITREPNQMVGEVHNRMPVILTRSEADVWLNTQLSYPERAEVLKPIENSALLKVEISKSINKADNKSGDWFKGPDVKPLSLF